MSFVSLQQTSSESAKSAYTFIFGHIILQRFLPKSFSGEFLIIYLKIFSWWRWVGGGAGGYLEQGSAPGRL